MTNEIMKNIYNNVKYLCKRDNITLAGLEKELGVAVGYMSKVYGKVGDIGILKVVDISERFNVPIDELIYKDLQKRDRIAKLREELERLVNGNEID